MLQKRAWWSDHGGTWGLPGGALWAGETAKAGALREATEEAGIHPHDVTFDTEFVDNHGGWVYTTLIAHTAHRLATRVSYESSAIEWVGLADLATLDLHPGLEATLPQVIPLLRC